jgi:hypothetical protein
VHEILDDDHIADAAQLVKRYYGPLASTGRPRSGAYFDEWAEGGDAPGVAMELTAEDFVAVSMLAVNVPAEAAIGLKKRSADVNDLLALLPIDTDLTELDQSGFDEHLGKDSAGQKLWDLLRGNDGYRWDIGHTIASKMMARKRPKLFPIFDTYVGPMMGHTNANGQWETWWNAFQEDGKSLGTRLDEVLERSEVPNKPSRLRVMDIVLWLHAKDLEWAKKQDNSED